MPARAVSGREVTHPPGRRRAGSQHGRAQRNTFEVVVARRGGNAFFGRLERRCTVAKEQPANRERLQAP